MPCYWVLLVSLSTHISAIKWLAWPVDLPASCAWSRGPADSSAWCLSLGRSSLQSHLHEPRFRNRAVTAALSRAEVRSVPELSSVMTAIAVRSIAGSWILPGTASRSQAWPVEALYHLGCRCLGVFHLLISLVLQVSFSEKLSSAHSLSLLSLFLTPVLFPLLSPCLLSSGPLAKVQLKTDQRISSRAHFVVFTLLKVPNLQLLTQKFQLQVALSRLSGSFSPPCFSNTVLQLRLTTLKLSISCN